MEGISKSSSSRRKAAPFSLKVKLSDTGKSEDKMNGNNKCDEISVRSTDTDSDDSDIVELPEGTVVIEPEPVEEKAVKFKGPEFKSANKKPAGIGGAGSKELDNIFCTACGKQMNPWKTGTVKKHKGLKVLICRKCYNFLGSGEIAKDEDGMDEQCQWCGEGGRLTVCDKCPHAFCKGCIMRNFGRAAFTDVTESENWECYICDPQPLEKLRNHCCAVFEAIAADNAKKSSTKSSQSNADKSPAVTNNNKSSSSSLAAGVSSSKSSSKSQSEFADDPASVLTQLFSNIDIDENDVLFVTGRLLEATSTFRSLLLGIQQAIDEDGGATDHIAKDIQVLPFSAELSMEKKVQQCAKVLKKGLQIFVSSSGRILQKKQPRTKAAGQAAGTTRKAPANVSASERNGSTSGKSTTAERSSKSSPSDNQSQLEAGYIPTTRAKRPSADQTKDKTGKTVSLDNSDCEKTPSPSGDTVSGQTKDRRGKTVSLDNSDGEKSPSPPGDTVSGQTTDRRGKTGSLDDSDGEKSPSPPGDTVSNQTTDKTGKTGSLDNSDCEKSPRPALEKRRKIQETASQLEKTVKEQSLCKKVVKSSKKSDLTENNKSGKLNNVDAKNIKKDQEDKTKENKKKNSAVHTNLEHQVESANAKKKHSVKRKPSSSEESTKSDGQEAGRKDGNMPVGQIDIPDPSLDASSSLFDTSTQEENLFAKLELIQELAQEISREVVNSDAEKTGQEGISDYEDSDCDNNAESQATLGANKPAKSSEKLNTSTPMKTDPADRSLKEFSDISDVESDSDRKPQTVKQTLPTEGQASTSGGKESKAKDSQSCDNQDQGDSDSVSTFSSDDDFEPRRKKKGIKRRKRTPGRKSGPADDGQEESADSNEESAEGKSKRRIKTTPKKESRKKMTEMSEEDEEESDFSNKTSEKKSSKDLDRVSKVVQFREKSESKCKPLENGSEDTKKESEKSKKENEKPQKENEKAQKENEKPQKESEKSKKENEKAKKENEKAKKDLDSDEEDEELERDIDSLLRGDGKRKKKRNYSEDGNDDDQMDSDEEEEILDHKKGSKGKAAEKTTGKKVSSEESSESDANNNDEEEEDGDTGNSEDEEDAHTDLQVDKSSKGNDTDLENKNAKDLLDDMDEDNNEDDEESDESDDGDSSSEEEMNASKKRKRKAVAEKKVKTEEEDEEENDEQKDNSESDFEPPGSRKRIKSKLLDAKISDSDSDFEVQKRKGKKRKRDSDAESFKDDKSDESEDEDDDDSVVNSDDVSEASEDLSDDGSGGKKGKGKGKGKAGKDKGKKRRRIKKMDSSDEEAPVEAEGEENEDDPGSRKKIRKIKSDKKLGDTTKAAARAEEERRKRVTEKQKKFNGVEQKDAGDGQAPITTKLVLEQDEKTGEPIIQVNSRLIVKLKPHQVEAVQFMWDCLFESLERSKKPEVSAGCILAHCMGLGKTLSVVSFIHTMMTHQKLTKVKTCLVVSPLNTVLNWQNEFQIWLDEDDQLTVYEMASVKLNPQRAEVLDEWHKEGGIMIMGYEMLRNLSQGSRCRNKKQKAIFHKTLIDPGPDIVVCDEGHIMKNAASALSKAMNTIKTRKRIVLTGTPLQNNLIEYHCMVDFVKPNLLGTKKEFANRFVNPIINGQHSDSTPRDVRIMKNRAHILHELLAGCVQRRDYSALTKFLPPKQEYVISVRLTPVQVKLYEEYLKRQGQVEGAITSKGAQLFKDYQNLMKIWTHPWVLKLAEIRDEMKMKYDDEDSFIDDEYSDEEKFLADTSSESSEEEEETTKMSDHSNESAGEGPSTGRRSRRLRNKEKERLEDRDEIVKEWKTRSRGGDIDLPEEAEAVSQAVSNEWWAEYVKEEDKNKLEHSGKLALLFDILRMCEEIGDKVLIFSQSLLSLDIIEFFLEHVDSKFTEETQNKPDEELKEEFGKRWTKGDDYFRLDGSTSAQMRQHWAGIFNSPENHRARLFLISTRAGGLGINLIGANRVIIFDASWNPSHDVQSIFRVYRFGQNKPCYIYRFMAQGTMEEKIYDRQVMKLSLSQRVVDEHQVERHFSAADLQELYVFRPELLTEGKEQKTLMLPKDILLAEIVSGEQRQWFVAIHEHDSLLENLVEQELTEEEKKAAWEEYENEKKGLVKNVSMGPVNMGLGNYLSQEFLLQTARNLRMQYPEMSQEVLQMHLQRIIMMQIRQKQEEQRRLEMMERQQASQFLQMQQRYAQLQQQYLQQMAGQQGAGYPGMMPLTPGQRFSPSLYAHMAQPGLSSFHHGTSMVGAAADGAGSSKASSGTSPSGKPEEVIDLDESTD